MKRVADDYRRYSGDPSELKPLHGMHSFLEADIASGEIAIEGADVTLEPVPDQEGKYILKFK